MFWGGLSWGGAVVCWRAAWRWVLGASLAVGVGVPGWALHAQWRSIGATNPYFGSRPETQSVWWSGILGVWLPALLAVAVASVATDAGTTLYFQPSIPRGIQWALQGAERITWTAVVLTCGTMVVSLYALRELNEAWTGRRAMLLVPIGLWAAAFAISQLIEQGAGFRFFFSTIHVWWAWGVIALGAAAGLRVLFLPVSGKMEYHRRDSA